MAQENSEQLLRSLGIDKIDADLAYLTRCFAEMLTELGEERLAKMLPWGRGRVSPVNGREADRVSQAYSIAFQLLNMVEENAAAQTRRARETQRGPVAEPGLWGHQFRRMIEAGIPARTIAAALPSVSVEPVLTAHPTEAKRSTVLELHRSLYLLLVKKENQMWSPSEQEVIREEVKTVLEQIWRTGEILVKKPDVAAERRAMMHYLRDVFPRVLPVIDRRLASAWQGSGLARKHTLGSTEFPRLRFGTWVGGDRDGHPLVTAEVTRETLEELHLGALASLQRQLGDMAAQLTLSEVFQQPPKALRDAVDRLSQVVTASVAASLAAQHSEEPWRHFATLLQACLALNGSRGSTVLSDGARSHFTHPQELMKELLFLEKTLEECGAGRVARMHVHPVVRSLDVFGFHLAALDVRQNSLFHEHALSQILSVSGVAQDYSTWDEARRLAFLERELASARPFLAPGTELGHEAGAVLACYRVLASHIEAHGAHGIGALIVSMTRSLSDLLTVYLLAREAGIARFRNGVLVCQLQVVPLFETVEDLQASPAIMGQFLAHPVTAASLLWQGGGDTPCAQQVMIGYSDSNKESGIFSSQWSLFQAQQELAQVGSEHGCALKFFHGRGGTISRGAGPTHRFLEALAEGSLGGEIRMTEQGETIAQKYANQITAAYNLELLLAGVTSVTLLGSCQVDRTLSGICERLSSASRHTFRALVEADGFLEFYTQATPIDVLEHSSIGSRPSRRRAQASLADLRAIPWVFSWTQSRFFLPGWYGVGSALALLKKEAPADFARFCGEALENPFVKYLLTNIETNMASADLGIMAEYASLVKDAKVRKDIFGRIAGEFRLTERMLIEIYGASFEQRRPRMFKTLKLRSDALKLLHAQQIRLLGHWREARVASNAAKQTDMLPSLMLTVNAIASGLRTTG